MLLGLKRDIVVHFAADGAGAHIGGSAAGNDCVDVATVAGEAVVAMITEVADVADSAAGGNDLDERAVNAPKGYVAAERVDFDVAILHVGQSDRTIESLDVHVSVGNVAYVNGCGRAFQGNVAVKLLGAQAAGAGMQGDAGVGGDENLVIDASGLGICSRKQMGLNLNPVADQCVVDFNFIGGKYGADNDEVAGRRLYRNRAIGIIDGNSGSRPDIKPVLLARLGEQRSRHDGSGQDSADGGELNCVPAHKVL